MMSDFASMDWDLQAVIRGWSSAGAAASTDHMTAMSHVANHHDPLGDFDPGFNGRDQDLFFGTYPDVFESPATADFFDELEGMFKPFYQPAQPQGTGAHASSGQLQQQPAIIPSGIVMIKQEEPLQQSNGSPPVVSAVTSTSTAAQVAKYKRRKNQQKRVVQQARAEGLSSSDKWAWRKYGQKPIKGSPYPRSYYRCSSSKGCPARKQVEQSCADPGMYVITYTGDHNHSHPTRRNSLSGVARCRFSAPRQLSPTRDHLDGSAPTTFLSGESIVKSEEDREERSRGGDMEMFLPDGIVFSDDLFPSLEDLHGCIMD